MSSVSFKDIPHKENDNFATFEPSEVQDMDADIKNLLRDYHTDYSCTATSMGAHHLNRGDLDTDFDGMTDARTDGESTIVRMSDTDDTDDELIKHVPLYNPGTAPQSELYSDEAEGHPSVGRVKPLSPITRSELAQAFKNGDPGENTDDEMNKDVLLSKMEKLVEKMERLKRVEAFSPGAHSSNSSGADLSVTFNNAANDPTQQKTVVQAAELGIKMEVEGEEVGEVGQSTEDEANTTAPIDGGTIGHLRSLPAASARKQARPPTASTRPTSVTPAATGKRVSYALSEEFYGHTNFFPPQATETAVPLQPPSEGYHGDYYDLKHVDEEDRVVTCHHSTSRQRGPSRERRSSDRKKYDRERYERERDRREREWERDRDREARMMMGYRRNELVQQFDQLRQSSGVLGGHRSAKRRPYRNTDISPTRPRTSRGARRDASDDLRPRRLISSSSPPPPKSSSSKKRSKGGKPFTSPSASKYAIPSAVSDDVETTETEETSQIETETTEDEDADGQNTTREMVTPKPNKQTKKDVNNGILTAVLNVDPKTPGKFSVRSVSKGQRSGAKSKANSSQKSSQKVKSSPLSRSAKKLRSSQKKAEDAGRARQRLLDVPPTVKKAKKPGLLKRLTNFLKKKPKSAMKPVSSKSRTKNLSKAGVPLVSLDDMCTVEDLRTREELKEAEINRRLTVVNGDMLPLVKLEPEQKQIFSSAGTVAEAVCREEQVKQRRPHSAGVRSDSITVLKIHGSPAPNISSSTTKARKNALTSPSTAEAVAVANAANPGASDPAASSQDMTLILHHDIITDAEEGTDPTQPNASAEGVEAQAETQGDQEDMQEIQESRSISVSAPILVRVESGTQTSEVSPDAEEKLSELRTALELEFTKRKDALEMEYHLKWSHLQQQEAKLQHIEVELRSREDDCRVREKQIRDKEAELMSVMRGELPTKALAPVLASRALQPRKDLQNQVAPAHLAPLNKSGNPLLTLGPRKPNAPPGNVASRRLAPAPPHGSGGNHTSGRRRLRNVPQNVLEAQDLAQSKFNLVHKVKIHDDFLSRPVGKATPSIPSGGILPPLVQ